MSGIESRTRNQSVDVEIRRGLFGLRKRVVHMEAGDGVPIGKGLHVENGGSYFWIAEKGLEGRNVSVRRALKVSRRREEPFMHKAKSNFFPYHIPEGFEIKIKTPSMRVKVSRG